MHKYTILAGTVGSTAYGLNTPDSDIDTLGIYVAPIGEVLGLDSAHTTSNTVVTTNPDTAHHEVGKYCSLALKTNPTALELLYLNEYTTSSPLGLELVSIRDAFLSTKSVHNAYRGFAVSQLNRILRHHNHPGEQHDARNTKLGRHCARLLLQGTHLLTHGTLPIDVSGLRDELFRLGDLAAHDSTEFQKFAEKEIQQLDAAANRSVLPLKPARTHINEWLIHARLTGINTVD